MTQTIGLLEHMRWLVASSALQPLLQPARLPAVHASAVSDPDIIPLSNGDFYNKRLGAHNVFEVDLDPVLIDEAAAIVRDGSPFAELEQPGDAYVPIKTAAGLDFFAHRVSQWDSNIAWISCDNALAFGIFNDLFSRMKLEEHFASVVPHKRRLQMYNAFYVTRSWCNTHNFHTDYAKQVRSSLRASPLGFAREK